MKNAPVIEDIIDTQIRAIMHDHIHAIVQEKLGKHIADLVEAGVIRLTDIDIFPHERKLQIGVTPALCIVPVSPTVTSPDSTSSPSLLIEKNALATIDEITVPGSV